METLDRWIKNGFLLALAAGLMLCWSTPQAAELRTCDQDFIVDVVNASSQAAKQLFAADVSTVPARRSEDKVLGIWNSASDVATLVYVSSVSTTDETRYGWPVAGGQTRYFDFGPNVKVFTWMEDLASVTEIRGLSCK